MKAPPYTPLIHAHGGEYYPEPYSAPILSPSLQVGLVPVGLLASCSVASTLLLSAFILHRFWTWKTHYKTFVGYNQYVVLVLNLLLADLQQSSAFLISWHWYDKNEIMAPTPACFAQGWLLHSGDISSGFFVLSIAVHTYYNAVLGRRLGHRIFVAIITVIWCFAYFLTAMGLGLHGRKYFVRAGAWCWVSSAYETDRLWFHYIWVFIVEFATILIYVLTFYHLRKKTRSLLVNGQISPDSPNAATIKAVNRITMLMTLYPCVYVLLTLPLSAGRMWSMNHHGAPTSDVFSCIAGSLLTSCGWVDSLLYTLTRKRLLQDTMPSSSSRRALNDREMQQLSQGITQTRTVTVESGQLLDFEMMTRPILNRGRLSGRAFDRPSSSNGSVDPILSGRSIPGVGVTTEITVGCGEDSIAGVSEKREESDSTVDSVKDDGHRHCDDDSRRRGHVRRFG